MESEALNILNNIGFGSAIAVIVFVGGLILSIKKALQKHDEKIRESVQTESENTEYKNTVEKISTLLDQVVADQKSMKTQLDSITKTIESDRKETDDVDAKLEQRMDSYEDTLKDVSMKVDATLDKFDLLIESDKETMKAFIIGQFKEAQKDKCVDWLVMESIEQIYKTYLAENGDSFIRSIIVEMRTMPKKNITTTTDENEK